MKSISKSDFEKTIESKKLVLVDFFATWCGPCQMMLPIIDEVEKEYEKNEKVAVVKIDVDESPEIAAKYSVMSVPTFLLIKNQEVVDKMIGAVAKDSLIDKIEKYTE